MKLEIGSGNSKLEGYIHTDCNLIFGNHVEVVCRGECLPFKNELFTSIYMRGVFEHFTYRESVQVLGECNRVLCRDGLLELTVPDLMAVCRILVNNILPFKDELNRSPHFYAMSCLYGGQDRDGQVHQWAWTQLELEEHLRSAGFIIEIVDNGCFELNTHLHIIGRKK